jgi:HJR/Mrr/RecB family endonuclease
MIDVSPLEAIKKGCKFWNDWRAANSDMEISFKNADLKGINLKNELVLPHVNLSEIDFSHANFEGANLYGADLTDSKLDHAILKNTSLYRATCKNTSFRYADLEKSCLHKTIFDNADFTGANLKGVDFTILSCQDTILRDAKISNIELQLTPNAYPWDVDPFGLLDTKDFHLVDKNDQKIVYDYLKWMLHLANVWEDRFVSPASYTELLNRINSIFKIFEDQNVPTTLISVVELINVEMLKYIKSNPKYLHNLHWRAFEELIAEILASFGWQVELTSPTKDNGYDIFAIYKDASGIRHNWIIECKKWDPERKVGVEVIRNLYGVKTDLKVGNALIATTSSFTKGVEKFKASHYDLETKGFNDIVSWVNQYKLHPSNNLYIKDNRIDLK